MTFEFVLSRRFVFSSFGGSWITSHMCVFWRSSSIRIIMRKTSYNHKCLGAEIYNLFTGHPWKDSSFICSFHNSFHTLTGDLWQLASHVHKSIQIHTSMLFYLVLKVCIAIHRAALHKIFVLEVLKGFLRIMELFIYLGSNPDCLKTNASFTTKSNGLWSWHFKICTVLRMIGLWNLKQL